MDKVIKSFISMRSDEDKCLRRCDVEWLEFGIQMTFIFPGCVIDKRSEEAWRLEPLNISYKRMKVLPKGRFRTNGDDIKHEK